MEHRVVRTLTAVTAVLGRVREGCEEIMHKLFRDIDLGKELGKIIAVPRGVRRSIE